MNYDEYTTMRSSLIDEANAFVNEDKLDEADAKLKEVEALDEKFNKITQARANVQAMQDKQKVVDLQNRTETVSLGLSANASEDKKDAYASTTYVNAWAKAMMDKADTMTDAERKAMAMVNEAHTTANTGVVIPKTVAAGIWDMIEEQYPFWDDVQKTYVKGAYSAVIGDDSTDAAWYDEATETADGKETLTELALTGCELSRSVTISWKLREMAIEDFIPYIQRKLARKMGAGLGYGATHGKGKPSANEFKPEPLGVVTALEKESGTPQVKTYTKGSLKYSDLTAARALVKVANNDLSVYANSATIWGELANVVDGNGNPIFIPDAVNNGVYRIFGLDVKQDDSMEDGEILFSAPYIGYIANVNKELSVLVEEHVKPRNADYCGYAVVDGGVTSTKAHALLKVGE